MTLTCLYFKHKNAKELFLSNQTLQNISLERYLYDSPKYIVPQDISDIFFIVGVHLSLKDRQTLNSINCFEIFLNDSASMYSKRRIKGTLADDT